MKASIITALLVSAVMTPILAAAQVPTVPRYINFQGKLTDTNGLPLNGTYEITFNIYSNSPVPAPANWVWGETHPSVEVQRGLFSVLLGSFTNLDISHFPFDAAGATNRWLEIRVGSDLLSPTKELVSVPYAFRASDADTLNGLHVADLTYTGQAPISITNRTISLNYSGDDFQLTNGMLAIMDKWVDVTGDTMTGDLTMAAGTKINGANIINSQAITDGTIINDDINANANIAGSKVVAATTTTRGTVELATSVETTAGLAVQASDTRLSDSRPSIGTAGGDLTGTYPNPQIAAGVIVNADVNANADIAGSKIAAASTTARGTVELATDGESAASLAVQANDSRLKKVGDITPNYVPRWDGSALVTGSIYDPGTGNVGIGTASPGSKLTVAGGDIELDSAWNVIKSLGRLHIQPGEQLYLNPWGNNFTFVGYGSPDALGYLCVQGCLGINTIPPSYRLDVNGDAGIRGHLYLDGYSVIFSDDRLKLNEQKLEYGLAQVMVLDPMRYDRAEWEVDPETEEIIIHPEKISRTNEIGLVAQDVYKVIPKAVHVPEDENRQLWGISYDTLIPVLVKAIQEQQGQIEGLKQEVQAMKSGTAGGTPVASDFDGDGRADTAMVSANGGWYFWLSSSGYIKSGPYNFGLTGKPAAADFDGDGKADPAMVDADGNWYIWLSASGYSMSGPHTFGI